VKSSASNHATQQYQQQSKVLKMTNRRT